MDAKRMEMAQQSMLEASEGQKTLLGLAPQLEKSRYWPGCILKMTI
jgi:hypothetical protein